MTSSAQRRLDRGARRIHENTRARALRLVARQVEPALERTYRETARRMIAELGIRASEDQVVESLRRHLPPEQAVADAIGPALRQAAREGQDGARQTLQLIEGGEQGHRPFVASRSPRTTRGGS